MKIRLSELRSLVREELTKPRAKCTLKDFPFDERTFGSLEKLEKISEPLTAREMRDVFDWSRSETHFSRLQYLTRLGLIVTHRDLSVRSPWTTGRRRLYTIAPNWREMYRLSCFDSTIDEVALFEGMACPGCGSQETYVGGLNNVECPTQGCRNFSQKQAQSIGRPMAGMSPPQQTWAVELDWAHDAIDEFDDWCTQNGVKGTILHMVGPAGGNPLVYIKGTKSDVEKAIDDFCMDDTSRAELIKSHMRKA